ncbi:hypothetical protein [Micromonospora maritima]|uniref:hypothetical protein n=1 Tax=Micromonospora maritima TaxID=986711 RepID=UPI00157DF2D3|nr:hypothetical protein [Micromonospora maritima]
MSMTEYAGQQRHVAGRLRFDTPPAPGTILGPNDTREDLVVLGQDGAHTLLGYATTEDRATALRRSVMHGEVRSVREHQMVVAFRG